LIVRTLIGVACFLRLTPWIILISLTEPWAPFDLGDGCEY